MIKDHIPPADDEHKAGYGPTPAADGATLLIIGQNGSPQVVPRWKAEEWVRAGWAEYAVIHPIYIHQIGHENSYAEAVPGAGVVIVDQIVP